MQKDYSSKSNDELIRSADGYLKDLKAMNKSIKDLIKRLEAHYEIRPGQEL